MCRAGVLEDVGVAELLIDAGHLAVLLYQHVDHTALDPGAPVGREERPKPRTADLQPGVRPAPLLAPELMLSAIRAFQGVNKDPFGARVVIAELQDTEFGRAQAGMVHQAEERAITRRIDHTEESRSEERQAAKG